MKNHSLAFLTISVLLVTISVVTACAPVAPTPVEQPEAPTAVKESAPTTVPVPTKASAAVHETKGPNGETATMYTEIKLTDEEKAKIREGNYTAAYLMHTSADFTKALMLGAEDAFKDLGIKLVATTDAAMDPTKQKTDVETVMALKPDIILTLVIDPVQGAEAFRPAVEAGTKLVFMSNVPQGYVQGKDYVAIVTDDLFGMGKAAAEMLCDAMGGNGDVGWIYHDANYYVTNQRDNAFKTVLQESCPGAKIVEEQGLANPADAEAIASAMLTKTPSIKGFYVPWDTPAEGVVAALRAANRPDVKVVTLDLGANNALDMAKGGNVAGIAADLAYNLGYTKAVLGAYGILGKEAPPFVIVPAIKVTKDNLAEGWRESLHQNPPQAVLDALK
jgi:ribose transport system substrate-binding protein